MANSNKAMLESLNQFFEQQAISKEVTDAMLSVDRILFVPAKYASLAYSDTPIPVVQGIFMQPPSIISLMINLAKVRPGLSVLELGTGTGYTTAILGELVQDGKVTAVEPSFELHKFASKNIENLRKERGKQYKIELVFGELSLGHWGNAPYDVVISNFACKELPRAIVQQLKADGRALVPIGDASSQYLLSYEKLTNTIRNKPITVKFPEME